MSRDEEGAERNQEACGICLSYLQRVLCTCLSLVTAGSHHSHTSPPRHKETERDSDFQHKGSWCSFVLPQRTARSPLGLACRVYTTLGLTGDPAPRREASSTGAWLGPEREAEERGLRDTRGHRAWVLGAPEGGEFGGRQKSLLSRGWLGAASRLGLTVAFLVKAVFGEALQTQMCAPGELARRSLIRRKRRKGHM